MNREIEERLEAMIHNKQFKIELAEAKLAAQMDAVQRCPADDLSLLADCVALAQETKRSLAVMKNSLAELDYALHGIRV